MNLRDLQYVIAVAEHQNFTRAAQAVAVSQPALSNQIKKLEAELGVPIFERGRDGVLLTAFGQELIGHATQITEIVDSIGDLARRHKTTELPAIRLGMTPTLAAYLSHYFRELFAKAASDRKIIIVEEYPVALARMVEERSIDMAFVARKSFDQIYGGSTRPLDFTSLWLEPLYLAVRSGHPLSRKSSIWAHEVPADKLIRFPISFGYDLERDLPPASDKVAEETGIDVTTARFETVCRYVAQSDAYTMVNAIAAEQFKRDGFGLSFLPFDDKGNMRELGALTRPQYPNPEIVEAMGEFVCQHPPQGTVASRNTRLTKERISTNS
ncbi:transcriptional regulator, LysR family protein [Rhodobacteraceae bacterium KLH11]|nr:transcriptional regulator, LysR family protein [Rhodobacteraceae bacterium KLH11]